VKTAGLEPEQHASPGARDARQRGGKPRIEVGVGVVDRLELAAYFVERSAEARALVHVER
jgi:hypothetical protein